MRVQEVRVTPEQQSLDPALHVEVLLSLYRGREVPTGLAVQVRAEDRQLLGVASIQTLGDKLPLEALESYRSYDHETTVVCKALITLTPKHLDYVEALRAADRKGDVHLHFDLEVHYLSSKTTNAHFDLDAGSQGPQGGLVRRFVTYSERTSTDPYRSQLTNLWVLSGDGGRTFLERDAYRQSFPVTISSGDWLHDYASPWMATRYLVVELPQPRMTASAGSAADARLEAALEATADASESLAQGHWSQVVEDLRPVWELLRNDADIQGLLQRDGYSADAIAAFNESVKQQFTFASKFIHRTDQSGQKVAPELRASKEDAMVCYSFALSLLNLVTRKAARLA